MLSAETTKKVLFTHFLSIPGKPSQAKIKFSALMAEFAKADEERRQEIEDQAWVVIDHCQVLWALRSPQEALA